MDIGHCSTNSPSSRTSAILPTKPTHLPHPNRERCTKKQRNKLTNVILYACMLAGNSEMLVFLSVFFPNNGHFSSFFMVAWGKKTEKC